jgi:hypothetical protein
LKDGGESHLVWGGVVNTYFKKRPSYGNCDEKETKLSIFDID